jgi:hypothetical protein
MFEDSYALCPVQFGRQLNVLLRWDYIPSPKLCKSTRALLLSQRNFLRLRLSTSVGYSLFSAKNRVFRPVKGPRIGGLGFEEGSLGWVGTKKICFGTENFFPDAHSVTYGSANRE